MVIAALASAFSGRLRDFSAGKYAIWVGFTRIHSPASASESES